MGSVSALIQQMGGPTVVAGLLGLPAATTVASWKQRESIPVEHWPRVVEVAKSCGVEEVTYEKLVLMHTSSPEPAQ